MSILTSVVDVLLHIQQPQVLCLSQIGKKETWEFNLGDKQAFSLVLGGACVFQPVWRAVCTKRGPKKLPPMPIATTSVNGFPVTPTWKTES